MIILQIKKKWYEMILSGEKKEDYRDIKPFYVSRFVVDDLPYYTMIKFKNGRSKDAKSFIANVEISIGKGKTKWGAVENKDYFVLKILGILNIVDESEKNNGKRTEFTTL